VDEKPKYEIYSKVLKFHCLYQTGFPIKDGCKEIDVKPGSSPSGTQYYQWLSGDTDIFEGIVGLGIKVDTFTGTHLTGKNQSPVDTGYLRLARRLGLDIENPKTDKEKQAIFEIQVAFGRKPTPGFYMPYLDTPQRLNLKAEHRSEIEKLGFSWDDVVDPITKINFRRRILDRSSGLNGAFGKSLYTNIRKTFRAETRDKDDGPGLVADRFVDAAEKDVLKLFFVLIQARQAGGELNDAEADMLAELTIQATIRSIDPGFWLSSDEQLGDPKSNDARLSRLRTRSSLVASMGFAGLHGLVIRVSFGRAPAGVYDLSEAVQKYEVAEAVLRALYDEACKRDSMLVPRLNPDVWTVEHRGGLRNHFDNLRIDESVAVLYIRSSVLDKDHSDAILSEVAKAINSRVILGSDEDREDLVRQGTQLTVDSLDAKLRILLTGVNRSSSDGARPA
jgi:hypothetical protein